MAARCRFGSFLLAIVLLVAPPVLAATYFAYTYAGIPPSADLFTWCSAGGQIGGQCNFGNNPTAACGLQPEGNQALRMITDQWGGFGVFLIGYTEDLSRFEGGDLKFFVASSQLDVTATIACVPDPVGNPPGDEYTVSISDYGWVPGTSNWQAISVPICDFFGGTCDQAALDCLSTIDAPFVTCVEGLASPSGWLIDYVRWEKDVTNPGRSVVTTSGHQLLVNGEPFVVEGVGYSPISIGENWQGAWRDRADRYLVDFPLMAAGGANAVRLYAPIMSKNMLDEAWANGLFVIPTFNVNTVQLTCAGGRAFEIDRFLEVVNKWKDHPAILFWLVGNETNANLGAADLCTDFFPQLDAFAAAAHAAEGANYHPVGTAMNDGSLLADICDPGCSTDLELPNVDLWAAQLYRGCDFGGAFVDYGAKPNCNRPFIVTESGLDAWVGDGATGMEDQAFQASCVADLIDDGRDHLAITGGVSAGQVLFSWTDEWWKADFGDFGCGTGWENHDGCAPYQNPSLPDPNLNEEYWGLVAQDDADPDVRTPRLAYDRMSERWLLGNVCNMGVNAFDSGTGNTTIDYDPSPGSTDHTLYYGPLGSVSSYGYSGSVTGLGVSGSASATLPSGSLFWVVVGRDNGAEGGYGMGVGERPPAGIAAVPQAAHLSGLCSAP
jgi:hypothetical protein